jgi:hypothetical protein
MLGETVDLEEYWSACASAHDVDRMAQTLERLLDKELGARWYVKHQELDRSFAAEYGPHLVEHLRLRLRSGTADGLWPADHSPGAPSEYRAV